MHALRVGRATLAGLFLTGAGLLLFCGMSARADENLNMLTDAEKTSIRDYYRTIAESLPGFRPRAAQRQCTYR